jgi:hypothetical protein
VPSLAVVTRVDPASVCADNDSGEGATVDLDSVPPQEALTTATASARTMRDAIDLGDFNDIDFS